MFVLVGAGICWLVLMLVSAGGCRGGAGAGMVGADGCWDGWLVLVLVLIVVDAGWCLSVLVFSKRR